MKIDVHTHVLPRTWPDLAERYGYATVLYLDALVMLVPLAMIPFLKNREAQAAPALA